MSSTSRWFHRKRPRRSIGLLPMAGGHVRVAQQFINRDPDVRKADQMPASTGLGEPRQGTHLSMLRTTHPRHPEGAPCVSGSGTPSPQGRGIWGEGRGQNPGTPT